MKKIIDLWDLQVRFWWKTAMPETIETSFAVDILAVLKSKNLCILNAFTLYITDKCSAQNAMKETAWVKHGVKRRHSNTFHGKILQSSSVRLSAKENGPF